MRDKIAKSFSEEKKSFLNDDFILSTRLEVIKEENENENEKDDSDLESEFERDSDYKDDDDLIFDIDIDDNVVPPPSIETRSASGTKNPNQISR